VRQVLCVAAAVCLTVLAGGCGKSPPPLAGGKPVSHWVAALQDREPKMRKKAATKLGNVGAADPAAVPALVGALKDPDAGVRAEAALALLRIGRHAAGGVEALRQAQQDRSPVVREYATLALQRIEGGK
jgi:HEAT repeat protein